jgi:hypothetical protein
LHKFQYNISILLKQKGQSQAKSWLTPVLITFSTPASRNSASADFQSIGVAGMLSDRQGGETLKKFPTVQTTAQIQETKIEVTLLVVSTGTPPCFLSEAVILR